MAAEAVLEVAVYLHRFHNLDLFQQGWYQIKVTSKWDGSTNNVHGMPSRLVQYEVPDANSDDSTTIWQMNDADHSFSTQPFEIKYARQDVILAMMISFNLAVRNVQTLLSDGVLICFELLYAPLRLSISSDESYFEFSSCAKHEFRLPSESLLGLHAYCPLHFDAWHMVLVDLTVHSILLKVNFIALPSEDYTSGNDNIERGIAKSEASSKKKTSVIYIFIAFYFLFEDGKFSSGMAEAIDMALWRALCASKELMKSKLKTIGLAINQNVHMETTEHSIVNLVSEKLDRSLSGKVLGELNTENRDEKNQTNRRLWTYDIAEVLKMDKNGILQKERFGVSKAELLESFQALGNEISALWNDFLSFHRSNRCLVWEYLKLVWAEERTKEWSAWVIHSMVNSELQVTEDSLSTVKKTVPTRTLEAPARSSVVRADLRRKILDQMKFNSQTPQDMQIYGSPSRMPVILIEQHNIPCNNKKSSSGSLSHQEEAVMLKDSVPKKTKNHGKVLRAVIFVHGFQGHHLDLRLIRNQWLLIDPGAQFLMSEVNEDRTMDDIKVQGRRLAEEVAAFLTTKLTTYFKNSAQGSCRLSFVGHSIGNLIIRSALIDPCLTPFLKYLHTFLSISGPHLGYLYSSNTVFNSGLWLLKKLKSSACMHQLTFTDQSSVEDCFLFKLSQERTFELFRHVLLVSSPQDRYVPYHSARINICQAASCDLSRGPMFSKMVSHCLDQILKPSKDVDRTFVRFDVNFNFDAHPRSLNNFIGRTAHIEFLETDLFLRFIMWTSPIFFS